MAQPAQAQDNLGTALTLEGRVDIYPELPLPEHNTSGGKAYAARLRGDARADLLAIVCTSGLPARFDLVNAMRTVDDKSVLRLREGGTLYWPSQNAYYYALAYEKPLAPRYWASNDETRAPMSEDFVNHYFIAPLIGALAEFQRTGIAHGAIRLTNIFWREGGVTPPQLGECLSAPAGLDQPVLYETIERALSQPLGRGAGAHVDDCYALGVALALVVLGHNPMQGMDDRAIVQAKMERGSFNAFVGNRRLASSHIELLRGLLTDDARQRWTASDLEQWQTGRRLTPKSTDAGRRASRHISVGGKEYWQLRPLASGLAANVSEAVKLIEDGSIGKWLQRSFGDEERAGDVDEAISLLKESSKTAHYEDRLVTRVCMALDPPAPIRYRGLSVMPSGIAAMMAEAVLTGKNAQVLSEIITNQFVTFWVNMQKEVKTDLVPLAQQLERIRSVIEKTAYGNGIERATYELNPALPCLSPMLRGQHVTGAKKMLPALERVASQPNRPPEPMDRHIAAFLIVRDKRSEILFAAMAPGESSVRRGLALLTLFGEMQYRYGPDQLPALAGWLLPLVEPGIKRFLSKPLREKVRRQAREAVEQGNLSALARQVDDPKRIERDEQEFIMARRMYADIQNEMKEIEKKLGQREILAKEIGRPVAASLASLLAILLIAFTLMRAIWRSMG